MNALEKSLKKNINQSGHLDFPGLRLAVYQKGKLITRTDWGKTYRYYDIASLTKIVFTSLWFMHAVTDKKISLDQRISSILPWYQGKAKIGELLNHSAGNKWWQPFYQDISVNLSREQAYQQMEKMCQSAPVNKDGKAVYSDIDFYLLGSIMQKIEGLPLLPVWERTKTLFLKKTQFHFNGRKESLYSKKLYAPTEKCPWRGTTLQGAVHDENCWALGGVAPHAGLFGRLEDLETYGLLLRKISRGQVKEISKKTFNQFTRRSMKPSMGDWGYGFMKPSSGKSSAGLLMSREAYGHTGFTGMSFWNDPTRDLFVCLMSNRVHPTRDNKGFVHLRPMIHDWIIEMLEEKK